jgi:hypothetical protein
MWRSVQTSPSYRAWLESNETIKIAPSGQRLHKDSAKGDAAGIADEEPMKLADLQKEMRRRRKVKDEEITPVLMMPPKARDPLAEAEKFAMSL